MSGDGPRASIVQAADEERKRRDEEGRQYTPEEWAEEFRPLREWVDPKTGGTLPEEHRRLILKLLAEHDERFAERKTGMTETCATCRFYSGGNEGLCRRYPPTVVAYAYTDHHDETQFEREHLRPEVSAGMFCGEWTKR